MPCTVSVSARVPSLFGANHREPYHCRMDSRTFVSAILNSSRLSGRIARDCSSTGMIAAEPQKSHRFAA